MNSGLTSRRDRIELHNRNMDLTEIYQENCIATMERMSDDFLDMTITSPPYDDLRDYNGYHFPVEEIAASLFQKTRPGGVVVWLLARASEMAEVSE